MTHSFSKLSLVVALIVALLVIAAPPAAAQTPQSTTTLSTKQLVTDRQICLASATNVNTPSLASGTVGSFLVVDAEIEQVLAAGSSSTCFLVQRGVYANEVQGAAANHGNGQKVWVLQSALSTGDPSRPIATTSFFNQKPYQPFEVIATPTLFGVSTASVTDVNGKVFLSSVEVDMNALVTGACWLNGATVTTDKHIAALWDSTGNLLATTTLAGTSDAGNASVYQCVPFTSPVALVGPAQYFVGVQGNGTTDNVQMYATGAHNYPTTAVTGGTFGTILNLTSIPTTFTASVGPLMTLY